MGLTLLVVGSVQCSLSVFFSFFFFSFSKYDFVDGESQPLVLPTDTAPTHVAPLTRMHRRGCFWNPLRKQMSLQV